MRFNGAPVFILLPLTLEGKIKSLEGNDRQGGLGERITGHFLGGTFPPQSMPGLNTDCAHFFYTQERVIIIAP